MKITIPNRVLIGHRSKNGRYYTKKALESCIPHAEGKKVFLNHPEKGERRKFEDLLRSHTIFTIALKVYGAIFRI